MLFFVIRWVVTLPWLKFTILLSLIFELMVIGLDDRMVNTHNRRGDPKPAHPNGTRLRRQPWLKRSLRSLSPVMSRPSYYGSWWPTLLVVAMRQEMIPL
jgi:hypothetical protein